LSHQEAEDVNVIFIMNDTLRRDHIAAYGLPAPWTRPGHEDEPFIETPNLDRLAAQSALFDRCYIASYPTVPNRRDLLTGRWGFLETGWEPLRPDDVLLPEVLSKAGILTQLFFDTLPMGSEGYGFRRGFAGWEWVRGQHHDHWITAPSDGGPSCLPHQLRGDDERMSRILRNSGVRHYERDYMAPRTFDAALDWLEDNYRQEDFFLWIDTWDPHEPFDPPPYDHARYADPAYDGYSIIYPQYGRSGYLTPAELNDIRALYAGEVRMVDRCVGFLLDKVHALGLDDNTLIIHTTDHGYMMGDHALLGKSGDLLGNLYEPTCRVGMFIRHPAGLASGKRIAAIVQPPDVMPTILDFFGLQIPASVQGQSLLPLMRGELDRIRDYAVSGRFIYEPQEGVADTSFEFDGMAGAQGEVCARTVSTERWSYICSPYDMPSELYDLSADPKQLQDLIDDRPDVAAKMHAAFLHFLEDEGAPEAGIAPFRRRGAAGGQEEAGQERVAKTDEMTVYVFRDNNGKWLATTDEAQARTYVTPAFHKQQIETMTLDELFQRDPRALVRTRAQFYWAEDLIKGKPRGSTNELRAFSEP
jgi:arylsulfatase A-like enzyme